MSYEQTYFDFYSEVPQSYTLDYMLRKFHQNISGESNSSCVVSNKFQEFVSLGFSILSFPRYLPVRVVTPSKETFSRETLLDQVLTCNDFEKQKELLLAAEFLGYRRI
jgi:hypothetical protein